MLKATSYDIKKPLLYDVDVDDVDLLVDDKEKIL